MSNSAISISTDIFLQKAPNRQLSLNQAQNSVILDQITTYLVYVHTAKFTL